jgi:hypothetical protein
VQPSATFEYLISTNPAKINKSYHIFSNLYTNFKCMFHYFEYLPGLDFHLGLLQALLPFPTQTEIQRCQLTFNLEKNYKQNYYWYSFVVLPTPNIYNLLFKSNSYYMQPYITFPHTCTSLTGTNLLVPVWTNYARFKVWAI